jgi:hypothetical protein
MVQEYVHGPTLKQILSTTTLSPGQAVRVIGEVATALEYASKRGILHRDLKPANVFVTTGGVCKLGDFGLAKMIGGQSSLVTAAGTILGTPSYMSPEQAEGKAEVDARTDVYSLAVMSYELLVGRLPFPPVPGDPMATVAAHISTPPPAPSSVAPGFPPKVAQVLLAGLAKDPKRRPRSAEAFGVRIAAAAQSAWPGAETDADLSAVAIAAAPAPPPAADAPRVTVSAMETRAWIAGGDETVLRPPAPTTGETLVTPAGSDQTVVRGEPDQTVPRPPSGAKAAGDTTVLQPPPGDSYPGQPSGAPAFVPRPPTPKPPPAPPAPAPPMTAVPFPAAEPVTRTFSAPPVQPPVYRPPHAGGRGGGLTRLLVPVLLLLALGAIALFVILRNSGPAAAVTRVQVRANPTLGHCPSATYNFIGTIFTNGGAGQVTYQWIQPDGTAAAETTQSISRGQKQLDVTLSFTYKGNGNADGDKTRLRVIRPAPVDSDLVSVQYRCP